MRSGRRGGRRSSRRGGDRSRLEQLMHPLVGIGTGTLIEQDSGANIGRAGSIGAMCVKNWLQGRRWCTPTARDRQEGRPRHGCDQPTFPFAITLRVALWRTWTRAWFMSSKRCAR